MTLVPEMGNSCDCYPPENTFDMGMPLLSVLEN